MITIHKIKVSSEKLIIEYKQSTDGTSMDSTITSTERARPEFYDCVNTLIDHLLKICELPDGWRDSVDIRGVSFSDSDGIMGATITGMRTVKTSNAPFVTRRTRWKLLLMALPTANTFQQRPCVT